jgi:hypothetical protein
MANARPIATHSYRNLPMLLTELNVDDINRLMHFRVERLLQFFASTLPYCLIQIDTANTLYIHSPDTEIVDELIEDFDDLCEHAWVILGARELAVYFGEEEIVRSQTCLDLL